MPKTPPEKNPIVPKKTKRWVKVFPFAWAIFLIGLIVLFFFGTEIGQSYREGTILRWVDIASFIGMAPGARCFIYFLSKI